MLMMVMIMVIRLEISSNIDNQTCRIVTDNVQKLSFKTQLINLVLAISSRQHRYDSINFLNSSLYNFSLYSGVLFKFKLVSLDKGGDSQTFSAVNSREIGIFTECIF